MVFSSVIGGENVGVPRGFQAQAGVGSLAAIVVKVILQPLMTISSARVVLDVDVLVFHRSPQTLDHYVVDRAACAIHAHRSSPDTSHHLFRARLELRMAALSDPHFLRSPLVDLQTALEEPSPAPFPERTLLVRSDDARRRYAPRYATVAQADTAFRQLLEYRQG